MENKLFLRECRVCLMLLVGLLEFTTADHQLQSAEETTGVSYAKLPLQFEPNQGQTDKRVNFLSRGKGYTLFLTPNEAVLLLKKDVVRMKLVSANPSPQITGVGKLSGKINYFIGNNRKDWHPDIPIYGKVRYREVYQGIDLVYYGNQGQLECDFVVAPGADPGVISLSFEGTETLQSDNKGNLVLRTADGEVYFRKPVIYQTIDGIRREVPGNYVLTDNSRVAFRVAEYDRDMPLVIDPVLAYSTYLGGSASDAGWAVAVDTSGNAYVAGHTNSTNFPTQGPYQSSRAGGADVFVAKIASNGASLSYCTYFGGTGDEYPYGIAIDGFGCAYITGRTDSSNLPTANPYQAALSGVGDAFVTKLNATGSALTYSTYLGGNSDSVREIGYDIAVDISGNAYVAGETGSANFPTANAYQSAFSGVLDAFVTKFNPAGTSILYSTFLGGSGSDSGQGIALDSSGNAYITGNTNSNDFPTKNPVQGSYLGGGGDAFVTKVSSDGSALSYSTYLGGSSADAGYGIAVDSNGSAFVGGNTASADFPTQNGFWTSYGGSKDGFVTCVNPAGSAWTFSTYLGGNGEDYVRRVAVDGNSSVYATGYTASSNFPTSNTVQSSYGGGSTDAFVTKLDSTGTPVYSTYLGGNSSDDGYDIAASSSGEAFVTGCTPSLDFPTENAFQSSNAGSNDVFVARIGTAVSTGPWIGGISPSSGNDSGTLTVTITGTGFQQGASAKIAKSGETDIVGQNTTIAANGTSITTTLDLTNKSIGTWDVVVTNPDSTSATWSSGFPIGYGAEITGIYPAAAGNIGLVTITVYGSNFDSGITVNLSKSGQQDITGSDVSVAEDSESLTVTFNLNGKEFGVWDVTATNPDGGTGLLSPGLTVEEGKEPKLWMELYTDSAGFRTGKKYPFYVCFGNYSGNVDLSGGFVFLTGIPSGSTLEMTDEVPVQPMPEGLEDVEIQQYVETAEYGNIVPLWFSKLGPGESRTVRIYVTVNTSGTFQLGLVAAVPPLTSVSLETTEEGAISPLNKYSRNNQKNFRSYAMPEGDKAALKEALEIAKSRWGDDNFAVRAGQTGTGWACGGAATDLLSHLQSEAGLGLDGWTAQIIEKYGSGVGHTTVMITSPDGQRNYMVDNYIAPMIMPMDQMSMYWYRTNPSGDLSEGTMAILETLIDISANVYDQHLLDADAPEWTGYWYPSREATGGSRVLQTTDEKKYTRKSGESADPNQKAGPEGTGDGRYIQTGEPLRYYISFENLETATADAREVIVTDYLDTAHLDLDTLNLNYISFGDNTVTPVSGTGDYTTDVDLRPGQNLLVRITVDLDEDTGTLTWRFQTLDPDTGEPPADELEGFLPPNVNPPEGQGSVIFSVMPRSDLANGDQISNQATIVFDTNAAINTEEWVNTIDSGAPASQVEILVSETADTDIAVQWTGTDAVSGIRNYALWTNMDGGDFIPWIISTTETSGTFTGESGHTYGFYSVATDGAGNVEAAPATYDAVVTVTSSSGASREDYIDTLCFIASAAFGSPLAKQVDVLKQFRGRYLLTNIPGKAFVRWYYTNGKIAAEFIKLHPGIKPIVRISLYPLIGFAYLILHHLLLPLVLLILGVWFLRYKQESA